VATVRNKKLRNSLYALPTNWIIWGESGELAHQWQQRRRQMRLCGGGKS